jgi:branched-chain amino acid transport system substrate-binding protein
MLKPVAVGSALALALRRRLKMALHRMGSLVVALAILGASLAGTSALAQDVVKIGAPLALTGALADSGKKQKLGFDLWLERVNKGGGISIGAKKYKVELVTYDYQTDGKRAGELAEKLISEDKVSFMIAPFGSGHTKITAAVAERYGVPIVAVASSEAVHDQGFKYLFGTLAPSSGLIEAMLTKFKATKPDLQSIAILGREDVFPKLMADLMKGAAENAGLKVVYSGTYPIGSVDHSAALTAMRQAKPDWVYITGYSQDLILARKQMADLGLKSPIVTMITGPVYKEFIDALGPLAENVTSASWWHWATPFKSDDVFGTTKEFYDAVVKASGGVEPDYVHASSAASLIVLQKAIEKAASLDREQVRKALAEMDSMTFFGPIKFRADGMNETRALPLIQIQGGKPVLIYPNELSNAPMKLN